ncbi:hypothetical protein BC828DRAFT_384126 [Blastocladiella britannica]|nr:hypothetical protein BC828DRAFT_384126 [Blastocladiella britannica]
MSGANPGVAPPAPPAPSTGPVIRLRLGPPLGFFHRSQQQHSGSLDGRQRPPPLASAPAPTGLEPSNPNGNASTVVLATPNHVPMHNAPHMNGDDESDLSELSDPEEEGASNTPATLPVGPPRSHRRPRAAAIAATIAARSIAAATAAADGALAFDLSLTSVSMGRQSPDISSLEPSEDDGETSWGSDDSGARGPSVRRRPRTTRSNNSTNSAAVPPARSGLSRTVPINEVSVPPLAATTFSVTGKPTRERARSLNGLSSPPPRKGAIDWQAPGAWTRATSEEVALEHRRFVFFIICTTFHRALQLNSNDQYRKALAYASRRYVADNRTTRAQANQARPNEDICASCGSCGSLLCCDECPRSFHAICLDPPLDPAQIPDNVWMCRECALTHKWTLPTITPEDPMAGVKYTPIPLVTFGQISNTDSTAGHGSAPSRKRSRLPPPAATVSNVTATNDDHHHGGKRPRRDDTTDTAGHSLSSLSSVSSTASLSSLSDHGDKLVTPSNKTKKAVLAIRSLFAALTTEAETSNPRAFSLPRNAPALVAQFPGVDVDGEGEFELALPPPTLPGLSAAAVRPVQGQQQLQLQQNKCPMCQLPPSKGPLAAYVATCAVCETWWHCHCLTPPKTEPPAPGQWMCVDCRDPARADGENHNDALGDVTWRTARVLHTGVAAAKLGPVPQHVVSALPPVVPVRRRGNGGDVVKPGAIPAPTSGVQALLAAAQEVEGTPPTTAPPCVVVVPARAPPSLVTWDADADRLLRTFVDGARERATQTPLLLHPARCQLIETSATARLE